MSSYHFNSFLCSVNNFVILSFAFVVLNVADVLLTRFALQNGLSEANPLFAANLNLLLPMKIAGIILIFAIAYLCERKYEIKNTLMAPNLFMSGVVMWNIVQIVEVT